MQLTGQGGRVWVTGLSSSALRNPPADWRSVAAPAGSIVSTTGALVATSMSSVGVKKQRPGDPQPVRIHGQLLQGSRAHVTFTVPAASGSAEPGSHRSGASLTAFIGPSAAATADTTGSATTPVSADRTCGIPLDDPTVQAYQPDFAQVEWAADRAAQGTLTNARPAGLYGSALPSYTPQGMFPLPSGLIGGGTLPAQVLLGVLTQESNLQQASTHVIQGQASNPLTSFDWYGNWQDNNTVETDQINWAAADCGYGIGQVTTGMCIATYANNDPHCQYVAPFDGTSQLAIAVDYQANIAESAQILEEDWNMLQSDGITMNGGQANAANYIENWYMALWAYNSGLEPGNSTLGNTTGCTPSPSCTDGNGDWGLGFADNPANKVYPPDRPVFPEGSANNYLNPAGGSYGPAWDMSHPQYWPYQEKVISWAFDAITLWDYNKQADVQAFAWAHGNAAYPPTSDFCTSANNCNDSILNPTSPNASDPCQLSGSYLDHCWWHWPVTWTGDCTSGSCGTSVLTYGAGAAAPANPTIAAEFAPDCTLGNLAGHGAVIVGAAQSAMGCPGQDWTNGGPMTWNFAAAADGTFSSKIFFDQIGAGFGGHFWFAYTIKNDGTSDLSLMPNTDVDPERAITGTWPAPGSVSGWNEILVHIPSYGAWAVDANYQIDPGGGGAIEHRVIDQAKQANTWVNLGIFHLGSGASVSLSNVTNSGGGIDIAWNDVAFVPTSLLGSYVAMGDSYSSGEGVLPFTPDSDYSYNGMIHSCHRSPQSYPYAVTWGGHALPISSEAADPGSGETFADTTCSGIESNTMSWDYPVIGDPSGGSEADCPVSDGSKCNESIWEQNGNVDWGGGALNKGAPIGIPPSMAPINMGELPQTDTGWLDSQTALVTLTIGGNDARFSDIVAACSETDTIVSFDGNGCSSSNYYLTRASNGAVDPLPLYQMEPLVINREEPHIEGLLDIIAQEAPNALILVLGYPRPFPGDLNAGSCTGDALVDFIAPDTEFLNHMGDLLDGMVSQAVTGANASSGGGRIHYLDTNAAFETHRLCDSSYPDINGIVNEETSGSGTSAPGVDTFHPTLQGQEALAGVVNAFLAGN